MENSTTPKRFMSLSEASSYLSLPLSYLYRLSSANKLPGKVVWGTRTIRVDRLALDAWIEGQEVKADGEAC